LWTFARGAIQTSNLADLLTTAERVFSGELLSPQSYAELVTTDLRGKTSDVLGCRGSCFKQSADYTYGLGIVTTGSWLVQGPLFSGESAVAAYLPSLKVAMPAAVAIAMSVKSRSPIITQRFAGGPSIPSTVSSISTPGLVRRLQAILADQAPPVATCALPEPWPAAASR
jgi:hypothetical protein